MVQPLRLLLCVFFVSSEGPKVVCSFGDYLPGLFVCLCPLCMMLPCRSYSAGPDDKFYKNFLILDDAAARAHRRHRVRP